MGLGFLDISVWFGFLYYIFGGQDAAVLGNIMVMNGMAPILIAAFNLIGFLF